MEIQDVETDEPVETEAPGTGRRRPGRERRRRPGKDVNDDQGDADQGENEDADDQGDDDQGEED